MKGHNRIIIIAVVVIIIAFALYYFLCLKKKTPVSIPASGVSFNGNENASDPVPVNTKFPLKKGSKGAQVMHFQKYLNSMYDSGIPVTGLWDDITGSAAENTILRDNVSERLYKKWNLLQYN